MTTLNPAERDRDQQIMYRLAAISHRVDSIDQTQAFALRADAERHFEQVRQIFGKSVVRAKVYLAANGQRAVGEIANHLKMKQPNVSADLRTLQEEGLLEIIHSDGGANYWAKKPLDRTLRISKFLREEFGLDADGVESSNGKKRKK